MTRIRVPATSANLGPGFDTLGMALQFYNHFEAVLANELSVEIGPSTCVDTVDLPLSPSDNLLAKAYSAYFMFRKEPVIPAKLTLEAHIPLERGLGSSSTAIVGGLLLADQLHPDPLGKDALVPWAIELEGHPDNVVPALLGGIHCCLSNGESIRLRWPDLWGIILIIPPHAVSTEMARSVMPQQYTQQEAVENLRGIAAWMAAIQQEDEDLFRYALAADRLHQPARSNLIPEFRWLKEVLEGTEALGCVISGSGSTLAVYTPYPKAHEATLRQLKSHPDLIPCRIFSVRPDIAGACVVEKTSTLHGNA